MKKEEIKNVLGLGVPVYRPVPFKTEKLSQICSTNRKDSFDVINDFSSDINKKIKEVTGKTSKKTIRPFSKIAFQNALEDSSAEFTFGPERKIMNIFDEVVEKGLRNQGMSDEKYEEVKYINALNQFKRMNMPEEKCSFINEYAKLVRKLQHKADGMRASGKYGAEVTDYFVNQAAYYTAAWEGLNDILSYDVDKMFASYLDSLDVEKTVLYMAYTYLAYMRCFLNHGDKMLATELSFFVDGFLKNRDNRNLRMYINGNLLSYDTIKKEYEKLVKDNELTKIRLTHRLFEGKSFDENIDIINSLLNVQTVLMDDELVRPDLGKDIIVTTGEHRREVTPLTDEERDQVAEFVAARYYEYLKHNPLLQVEGKNQLSNYVAFLYENGMMPADRLNNLTRLHQTQDDRAFVFTVDNFDDLIGLRKSTLRTRTDVKAMNHTDTFEARMDAVITKETPEDMHERAREYVQKRK